MTAIDVIAPDVASFQRIRPRLFGIAYRIVGSRSTADDVVQDAWLRWHTANRREIRDATAFLTTIARRLAINVVQSAHERRETCAGEQMLERVDPQADPAAGAERGEALAHGVDELLEMLSPGERAVFILREGFDYPYEQIARVLGVTEPNARQIAARARRRLAAGEPRAVVADTDRRRLLAAVGAAARDGQVAALESLLTEAIGARRVGAGRR